MEVIIAAIVLIAVIIVLLKIFGRKSPEDYSDTRGRTRCGRCKKIVYRNSVGAQGAVDNAGRRGTYLRAYYERRCGYWHLTSQLPRSRRF